MEMRYPQRAERYALANKGTLAVAAIGVGVAESLRATIEHDARQRQANHPAADQQSMELARSVPAHLAAHMSTDIWWDGIVKRFDFSSLKPPSVKDIQFAAMAVRYGTQVSPSRMRADLSQVSQKMTQDQRAGKGRLQNAKDDMFAMSRNVSTTVRTAWGVKQGRAFDPADTAVELTRNRVGVAGVELTLGAIASLVTRRIHPMLGHAAMALTVGGIASDAVKRLGTVRTNDPSGHIPQQMQKTLDEHSQRGKLAAPSASLASADGAHVGRKT